MKKIAKAESLFWCLNNTFIYLGNATCEQSLQNFIFVIDQYCCPKAAIFSFYPYYNWLFANVLKIILFLTLS